jgi:hypothetical protein
MTYEGWKNYETWACALWLDNEYDLYQTCIRIVANANDAYDAAQSFKTLVEEAAPDLGASLYSDLLNAAISEIDWYEIVEHYQEKDEKVEGEVDE